MPLNPKLCRYKDILPYKDNIIKISNENQYINGSWINIPKKGSFIATQGPKDNTIEDFWQMCFDYNINVIIMLCNEIEDGKKKCTSYWHIKMPKKFKTVNIIKTENNEFFVQRKIEILNIKTNNKKMFSHIQFKQWPDHKIPNLHNVLLNFEKLFNFLDYNKGKSPPVIHCSAGAGRTGVFICLYILYKEIIENIKSKQNIQFNIFNLVRKIKECRLYSVENLNQYFFIYLFIEELLKERNINII